jgi:5-methylcytosine-specific restriction endonuclease McrA
MTATIQALHWTEQRQCSHPGFQFVRWLLSNGRQQVAEACIHCGHRAGHEWQPFAEHPDRHAYPLVVPHPDPCECHDIGRPALRSVGELTARIPPASYREYIEGPEWQERRRYYLARAMYRCQLCKRRGVNGRGLNVHHSDYSRLGAELEIDVIVLCRDCHARHHDKLGQEAA